MYYFYIYVYAGGGGKIRICVCHILCGLLTLFRVEETCFNRFGKYILTVVHFASKLLLVD